MDNFTFKKDKIFQDLLEDELNIYHSPDLLKSKTLEELHLTKPEIDLFLNRLETTYKVHIEEGEIKLETYFGQFIEEIMANSKDFGVVLEEY